MLKKTRTIRKGISLVDVAAATLIMTVVVLGTLQYRYLSMRDIRKAEDQLKATEIAVCLTESWKGVNGIETFDPVSKFGDEMDIIEGTGEDNPEEYTPLGKYDITSEEMICHASLAYKDVDTTLRELNVIVSWPFGGDDQTKTFTVSSYVLK